MAISSMTGFASAENEALVWEIRAVNHRFLELNFRLPEVCRHLEPALRAAAKTQLARGKVDCTLRQTNDAEARLEINSGVVEQVRAAVGSIDHLTEEKTQLSGLDLLKWPGVLTHAAAGPDELDILDGFNTALNLFKANREREGAATAVSILNRLGRTAIRDHSAYGLSLGDRLVHSRLNANIDFTDSLTLFFPMTENALQVIRFNPAPNKPRGHLNCH